MQNNLWQPADPGPYSGLPGGGQPYGLPHGTPASGPPSAPSRFRQDALFAQLFVAWIPPWQQPPALPFFTPSGPSFIPYARFFQDTTAWQTPWVQPPGLPKFAYSGPPSVPKPYRADGVLAKLLDAWAPIWQAPPALPALTLAPPLSFVPFKLGFQDTTAWQQPWVQPPKPVGLTVFPLPNPPPTQGFVLRDITAWLPPWLMPPGPPPGLPVSGPPPPPSVPGLPPGGHGGGEDEPYPWKKRDKRVHSGLQTGPRVPALVIAERPIVAREVPPQQKAENHEIIALIHLIEEIDDDGIPAPIVAAHPIVPRETPNRQSDDQEIISIIHLIADLDDE